MINPQHWDEVPFDAIVCNPPYSHKWVGDGNPLLINDPRFAPAGVLAPKAYEDFAFVLHCLNWLPANGTAAIVCWPGIMYRTGAEQKIRKYLIQTTHGAFFFSVFALSLGKANLCIVGNTPGSTCLAAVRSPRKRCKDSGSVGALSSCLYSSTIFILKAVFTTGFPALLTTTPVITFG